MNILQMISSEGYYGAEAVLVGLARNSSALGCNCSVAVFRDSRCPHTELADQARRWGVPVETIPCDGRWDWKAVCAIRLLTNKLGVDLLHTHGYKADLYGWAAAWPNRFALLSTCHNWPGRQPLMRTYAKLDRRFLRGFDKVVAVSDSVAHILLGSGVPPDKVATIPNGVDVDSFANAPSRLRSDNRWERKRLIGFVGRLVDDKGGAVLLRAAQQVVAEHANTLFLFVGEGPQQKSWEAMAKTLGIAENVVMLGARTEMPGIYASLDVLVLPSFDEATPMCILEALAARKPVIATAVGGVPKLVIHEMNGILVQAGDSTGLAAAILRLIRDPELGHRLGENGNSLVRQHFSAERMASAYLDQYRQALTARTGGSADWAASAARRSI